MDVVLPTGTKVYKGFSSKLSCDTVLKDTRVFFVTLNPRVAKEYSWRHQACPFLTRRPVRLFNLNHDSIKLIRKFISRDTFLGLQFAFGTNVLRGQQAEVYRRLMSRRLPHRFKILPKNRGERLSVTNINKNVFDRLTNEFLIKNKYDGFYSSRKKSIFHGGVFPSEIMLCDARRVLVKPGPERAPVLSRRSVDSELPQLFVQYCRKNRALLRPFRNYFIPLLGGGMGVRLYLEARAIETPKKVRDTRDFDFTFAVPHKLRARQAAQHFMLMKTIMFRHLNGFISWLNRTYTRTNARLVISEFTPDIRIFPVTKKYVYRVCQFRIQFPGKEAQDFVDATLAYVPGASREDIHIPYSKLYGLPIPRLKKLHDSVAAVLAASFVHPGVKPRNPLTGKNPEKGQKNVERLKALHNLAPRNVHVIRNLIQRIKKRNVRGAKANANKIIRYIQGKKK